MSISININFDTFEELEVFIADMNKYKKWKSKQEKKKKNNQTTTLK